MLRQLLIFYEIQQQRSNTSLLQLSPFQKDCIEHALPICSIVLNVYSTITRLIERHSIFTFSQSFTKGLK